ncbi:MAG: cyclic nucleotide-binding domain-containing protein, partial [Verrucomicrobiota bacterium]
MDQHYMLSEAPLSLCEDIEESKPEAGILILKNMPLHTYMVVNADQWMILKRFAKAQSMQALIPQLITERRSPPLRDLYELVLKAIYAGILLVNGQAMTQKNPVVPEEWRHKLRFRFAHLLSVACILFGFISLILGEVSLPQTAIDFVVAYFFICGCLSLGFFLSACLLAGFEREVYDVRFRWKHPFPHLYVNVEDARMAGRLCETTVALVQMAPLFFFTGAAAIWYPQLEYVLLLGALYMTIPDSRSPGSLLIRSVYRHIPLSTTKDFLFVQNQLFWTMLNQRIKFTDKRYLLIFSLYTLIWLSTLFFVNLSAFNVNAVELLQRFIESGGVKWIGVFLIFIMGTLILLSIGVFVWILLRNTVAVFSKLFKKTRPVVRARKSLDLTTDDIVAFFSETMLFKELTPKVQEALADRIQGLVVSAGKYITKQGEQGNSLYIIYDGDMEVTMNLKTGRPLKITELKCGDVFGEIAVIKHIPRTRSVRALRRSLLLTLAKKDFEELVVEDLGIKMIQDIVEKQAFLNRIELCNNWHPQALAKFVSITTFAYFKP